MRLLYMNGGDRNLEELQRAACERANANTAFLQPTDRVAIGRDFDATLFPINGFRHSPYGKMCGWHIWSGDVLSDAPDYFDVLCCEHLVAKQRDWVQYVALPAGWRFLAAPGYEDMWFDQTLSILRRHRTNWTRAAETVSHQA